jgi:hypothetical protein
VPGGKKVNRRLLAEASLAAGQGRAAPAQLIAINSARLAARGALPRSLQDRVSPALRKAGRARLATRDARLETSSSIAPNLPSLRGSEVTVAIDPGGERHRRPPQIRFRHRAPLSPVAARRYVRRLHLLGCASQRSGSRRARLHPAVTRVTTRAAPPRLGLTPSTAPGHDEDEALANAQEAIGAYIESFRAHGQPVPAADSLRSTALAAEPQAVRRTTVTLPSATATDSSLA